MACHMLLSTGSRLSLGCTLLLLNIPQLELVRVATRKSTGLGAVTVVTCLTFKYRSIENMPSAKSPVLQLLMALPPKFCISLPKKSTSPSPETPIIVSEVQSSFIFHCVDEKWQHESCGPLIIDFACCNKMNKGSPCMPLTQPKQTHPIGGDGNCMFRPVSYVMTGSQEQHLEVRAKAL